MSDEFIAKLKHVARDLDCKFTVKGQPIEYDKVFDKDGLLPGIMRRADQLCSFCLGYGLGVNFERSEAGMIGVTVEFNKKVPISLRLLCASDVVIELIQNAPSQDAVPLDDLMLE